MPKGTDPGVDPQSEPAQPASGGEPTGLPEPTAAPPAFDREAALAKLPDGLRAGLSHAPDAVLEQALGELGGGYIPKPEYTRKRQEETSELKELRGQLQAEAAQRALLERLVEQGTPAKQETPAPTIAELGEKLLTATDGSEAIGAVIEAVTPVVREQIVAELGGDPLLRRLRVAAAADAARPQGMDPETYRRGFDAFTAHLSANGVDPYDVEEQVYRMFVPQFAELERARSGNGAVKPKPSPPPGPPAVTPPSASGPGARTTEPDVDYQKTFGPESTLQERIAATLRQQKLAPGELARLRSGQRSV